VPHSLAQIVLLMGAALVIIILFGQKSRSGCSLTPEAFSYTGSKKGTHSHAFRTTGMVQKESVMLIGFVLLVSACGHDACDALPVSERIYPTKVACEQMADRIHKVRPNVVLLCGEVHR